MIQSLLLLGALALPAGAHSPDDEAGAVAIDEAMTTMSEKQEGLVVDRGKGRAKLFVPDGETLRFDVQLSIQSLIDTDVGDFVLSSGVEPFQAGLPKAGVVEAAERKAAWIKAVGDGGALGYSVDQTIETRLLPQAWPRGIYRDTLAGSRHKRRELMFGIRKGKTRSWYRSNHHCHGCERKEHFVEGSLFSSEGHCNGCSRGEHRTWSKPEIQEVPEGGVDMLSALHLARGMVRTGTPKLTFPLLKKSSYWDITLTRGALKEWEVPAGTFLCREIKMTPKAPEGASSTEKFKGLFGIHGSLSLWVHDPTGVPIVVEGVVPIGPLDLDVSIELAAFDGTPKDFKTK